MHSTHSLLEERSVMVFDVKRVSLVAVSLLIAGLMSHAPAKAGELLDVTKYGAKGDGNTDDQQALEKVFAIANRSPETIILFPAGTYLHSGRLTLGGSQIAVVGAGASLVTTNNSTQSLILTGNNITIDHMSFIGYSGADPAIQLTKTGATTIENCYFAGFTGDVYATRCNGTVYKQNQFLPGANGAAIVVTLGTSPVVESNTFSGFDTPSSQTGVQFSGNGLTIGPSNSFSKLATAVSTNSGNSLKVSQNSFNNCSAPVSITDGNTIEIDHNTLTSTDRIQIGSCTNVSVHDNTFSNIQTQGIYSKQNTGTVRISTNKLTNCGLNASTSPAAVIYADGGNNLTISDNEYTGNTTNLQYFIETPVSSAKLTGNMTNTMLPNKVGP
jgi:polygalacturonase